MYNMTRIEAIQTFLPQRSCTIFKESGLLCPDRCLRQEMDTANV